VSELSDQLAALRSAYETYKGSWEGTLFYDWSQLQARPQRELFDRMHTVVHQLDSTRNWALLPFYMTSLAEMTGQNGDVTGAAGLLERAAELTSMTRSAWCDAEIKRLQARYSAKGPVEATGLLQESLAIATKQAAKLWEVRAATDLAELLCNQAEHGAAREVLMPVYAWFSEGRNAADLVRARAVLDRIEQRRG
jgi:predicted ATPase